MKPFSHAKLLIVIVALCCGMGSVFADVQCRADFYGTPYQFVNEVGNRAVCEAGMAAYNTHAGTQYVLWVDPDWADSIPCLFGSGAQGLIVPYTDVAGGQYIDAAVYSMDCSAPTGAASMWHVEPTGDPLPLQHQIVVYALFVALLALLAWIALA